MMAHRCKNALLAAAPLTKICLASSVAAARSAYLVKPILDEL